MELLFKIQEFEGPLDLLVYLVQKKQLNIRQVSISSLADEFLFYINKMEEFNIDVASEFIATAAYLMELKSRSLLPGLNESDKAEYERKRELLYRRIEEYMRLKELVEFVKENDELDNYPVRVPQVFPRVNESKIVKIVKAALQEVELKNKVYTIKREKYSVEHMMDRIENEYIGMNIYDVLRDSQDKYELIVKFMAILELIRFNKIVLTDDYVLLRSDDIEQESVG